MKTKHFNLSLCSCLVSDCIRCRLYLEESKKQPVVFSNIFAMCFKRKAFVKKKVDLEKIPLFVYILLLYLKR